MGLDVSFNVQALNIVLEGMEVTMSITSISESSMIGIYFWI